MNAVLGFGTEQGMIVIEVLVAMILGGIIGYERQFADKPAGLRTHMLVAGAAALFVGLGSLIVPKFAGTVQPGEIRSDPIRIFEAIITGISFLGAGTIIFHRRSEHVEGITTAASLLMTAAIGATIGLAQWLLGIALTLLVFFVLNYIGRIKVFQRIHETTEETDASKKGMRKIGKAWTASDSHSTEGGAG